MSLRFTIAIVALAAALVYALFKIYQARPVTRQDQHGPAEAEQLQALLGSIPAGRVMTYAAIAAHLGSGGEPVTSSGHCKPSRIRIRRPGGGR